MSTVIFVQGACVRDQSWWWQRMHEPLARRGLATAAVDLPSCQMPAGAAATLHEDARAVAAAVDRADGSVLLCGHSYGGMVITEAGAHDRVTHLAYLTSVMPDTGESLAVLSGPEPAPWMDAGDSGTVGVIAEIVADRFLYDVDPSARREALARLTRQSATPFGQAPAAIAWRDTPSTFIVCADDHAIPPAVQHRHAERAGRVVEIAAGHFPFVTDPEPLAAALADAAGG
jgi:pimeloyl-ACP methyl ester carboxylesterase